MSYVKIQVSAGYEVVKTVAEEAQKKGIPNAAIVSLVGAVDEFCISNMPKGNAKDDILTEFAEPCEMSGTGEIVDGRVHLHCVFGREDNSTVSGHLHWANVSNWFVNAYVLPS